MDMLETREIERADSQSDKGAAINNLIRDRNTFLNTAKKLLQAGETRSLDDSERKEVDDLTDKVKAHDVQIRALQCRSDDDNEDDDGGNEDDLTETKSRSVNHIRASRSKNAMPAGWNHGNGGSWGIKTREHEYSLGRAVKACVQGRAPGGLEGEMSKECERSNRRSPRGNGFFYPFSGDFETRDTPTTTTTGSGGVTETWSRDFLLQLRRQSILEKLGVQTITDLHGLYNQPFETSGASASWVGEGAAVSANAMNISVIQGIPRQLTTRFIITRNMVASSSYPLLDELLYKDMVNSTAEQVSLALVNGNQITNPVSPQGILENANVGVSALASPPTLAWNDVLGMQTTVANNNPPAGSELKFLVSPLGAQILRNRPRINTGSTLYPSFIMDSMGSGLDNVNSIAGANTVVSPCVPDGITASGISGTLSAMLYGAFGEIRQLIFGNNLEFLVDPYSLGMNGEIVLYTFLLTDFVVPRPSLLTMAFFK
jgi:HK97 family phage major capsid protein